MSDKRFLNGKPAQGFTLLELMMVLVIASILAAYALPAYRDQALRSARTDAKADLMTYSRDLEACFSRTGNFSHADCTGIIGSGKTSSEGNYTLAFVGTNGTDSFTLRATPVSGKGQTQDTDCASFTVNNLGQQTALNSSSVDNSSECW